MKPAFGLVLMGVVAAASACNDSPPAVKPEATQSPPTNTKAPADDAVKVRDIVTKNTDVERGVAPPIAIASSEVKRVVLVRLAYGQDVLAGLKEAVDREKIKNAVILSAFGSVTRFHVHAVGDGEELKGRTNVFYESERSYDVINMSGMVLDGRLHPHITFADLHGARGGHLEANTKVFTFFNVAFGVLDDGIDVKRFDDTTWQ